MKQPLPDAPLFTAKEAAAKLNMSVKTLKEHVRTGRLRFINIGTEKRKQYRFTSYNLQTFIQDRKMREVPKCQLAKTPKAHTTSTISNSTIVAFSALQKPETKKTPKP